MRRATSDPQLLHDSVTWALSEVWRDPEGIPDDPDEELRWLVRVAHNRVKNERRARLNRQAAHERLAQELAQVTMVVYDLDERAVLFHAFESLSVQDREVLRLAGWEGMTLIEMARMWGVNKTTAAMRLSRARARLTEAIRRLESESGNG